MHQSRSTQTVGSVVREVGFTDSEQTGNGSHQFVVHPDTAHRVVRCGINHHRSLIGIIIDDFFIHLEEVSVTAGYGFFSFYLDSGLFSAQTFDHVVVETLYSLFAQAFDTFFEIEVNGITRSSYAITGIATFFGCARGHVARNKVTEGRITTFQVVVAIFFFDVGRFQFAGTDSFGIFFFLRNPDTTVVTQRLRHQSQFRLELAVCRNTSGVNLSVSRVGEISAFMITLNGYRAIRCHSVGRKEINVSVSAGSDNDSVCRESFNLSGNQITGDDTARTTVDNHEVEHLVTCKLFYRTFFHLTVERCICT